MAIKNNPTKSGSIGKVISVDAMGGDNGPQAVIAGMARALKKHPDIRFIVHGDQAELEIQLRRKRRLRERSSIRHCDDIVSMSEKPSHAMRNGEGSSMWSAVDAVRNSEARVAVSCGNTGALMAISMRRLRLAPGVYRPAIACLWPSRNPSGFNVLIDAGADSRAERSDFLANAVLGAAYAKAGLGLEKPRVGLLNVGTEDHKGFPGLWTAHELIASCANDQGFEYVGFVEGSDIPSENVDVVVTDGFTGNVALKSVEGTASLIRDFLRDSFRHTPLSRIGGLFAFTSLRRLFKRIDPRRVNGGVFLGLNGTIVKSHGSADSVAVEAAINLAVRLADSGGAEGLACLRGYDARNEASTSLAEGRKVA